MTKTEEKIVDSATTLFIQKGYRGASMRDIAAAAEVNIAMLNYYFRSKENLFEIIFSKTFETMSSNIVLIIRGEMSVLERINKFIHAYIDGIIQNPAIPGFLFNELFSNPSRISNKFSQKPQLLELWEQFCADICKEAKEGKIRKDSNPTSIMMNITSLSLFPAIVKPIIKEITDIDDNEYIDFLTNRKSEIYDIIESYLLVK